MLKLKVGDAVQPSHPCPPALNLSQHQGLFRWTGYLHQMVKVLELQLYLCLPLNLHLCLPLNLHLCLPLNLHLCLYLMQLACDLIGQTWKHDYSLAWLKEARAIPKPWEDRGDALRGYWTRWHIQCALQWFTKPHCIFYHLWSPSSLWGIRRADGMSTFIF